MFDIVRPDRTNRQTQGGSRGQHSQHQSRGPQASQSPSLSPTARFAVEQSDKSDQITARQVTRVVRRSRGDQLVVVKPANSNATAPLRQKLTPSLTPKWTGLLKPNRRHAARSKRPPLRKLLARSSVAQPHRKLNRPHLEQAPPRHKGTPTAQRSAKGGTGLRGRHRARRLCRWTQPVFVETARRGTKAGAQATIPVGRCDGGRCCAVRAFTRTGRSTPSAVFGPVLLSDHRAGKQRRWLIREHPAVFCGAPVKEGPPRGARSTRSGRPNQRDRSEN
jgi:hypothetical protein